MTVDEQLHELEFGRMFSFANWPDHPHLIGVEAAVYTIWGGATLLYAGMTGIRIDPGPSRSFIRLNTLFDRLSVHVEGKRVPDRFRMYMFDVVAAKLSLEQFQRITREEVLFSELATQYLKSHLSYRYVETRSSGEAVELELIVRRGRLRTGKPLVNPNHGSSHGSGHGATTAELAETPEIWRPIPT